MEIKFKGGTYLGELLNGVPHGKGKFTCCDYNYEGNFVNGKFHGRGKLEAIESWSEEAETYMYDSKGERLFEDGVTYEGEFIAGIPNGMGIFTKHGDFPFYEGGFVNGKANGQGKRVLEDGSVYEGIWVDDVLFSKHGYVTNYLETYEGDLADGLPNGKGVLITRHLKYEGGFKQGKFSGYGTLNADYQNSVSNLPHTYEGGFLEGKFHGQGIYVEQHGFYTLTYKGNFKNGKRHGEGTQISLGDTYGGNWQNGNRNGYGKLLIKDGTIVEGDWDFQNKQCIGTITFTDGRRFYGKFIPKIGYNDSGRFIIKDWNTHENSLVLMGWFRIDEVTGGVELDDNNAKPIYTFYLDK